MDNGSRQALAIENAETAILRLSKSAVLELWTIPKYKAEVEKVIAEAKKGAPAIADRIDKPLKDYATKVLYQQKQILDFEAEFFAYLHLMKEDTSKLEKMLGDTAKSEGFTKAVNEQFFKPLEHFEIGMPRQEYMKTYMLDVRAMYRRLVATNAQEAYDTNVSLRNIAEMTVRYDSQLQMISDMKKKTRLVWIVAHANCSERCEPYQGRLYSLDGTDGEIDGIPYKPLEYATDNPRDRYTTRAGITYQNGCITGFNCRHRLEPYRSGSKPTVIPAKVIEKQRAINDEQRAMEREIRAWKKDYEAHRGDGEAAKIRAKARGATEKYKAFCEKNKVAYYPDRIKIF